MDKYRKCTHSYCIDVLNLRSDFIYFFHKWTILDDHRKGEYAIVEDHEGKAIYIKADEVRFLDRKK